MRALPRIFMMIWILGLLIGRSASRASADIHYSAGMPAQAATSTQPQSQVGPYDTPVPVSPVITSTPASDGSIVHIVQYGETLLTIASAYGVKLTELKSLNNLSSDSIFVGDKLIIRLGSTPTPTGTATHPATATHRPTHTPRPATATPSASPVPSITPTASPTSAFTALAHSVNNQTIGISIIVICMLGLFAVGLTFFRTK